MKRRGIEFARSLIKGRIAETIFHTMMEEIETCTIIPFGYENYAPLLAQYQYLIEEHEALFLATPAGFFFSPCSEIAQAGGVVAPLPTDLVSHELQSAYLTLLNEFEH